MRKERPAGSSTLANVARQQVPTVLIDDAEVVDKRPVLFRTLKGAPLPEEKLDELIDFIRGRQWQTSYVLARDGFFTRTFGRFRLQ